MSQLKRISSLQLLCFALGIVFLWFGALKFFAGKSPAEDLAINTIEVITFGLLPSKVSLVLLAIWETLLGVFLLLGIQLKISSIVAIVHLLLTFSVLVIFPEESFSEGMGLTIIGQYVIKNLVLISALIVIYRMASEKKTT